MLPLTGLRVLEFTHAVMGPTTGLLLADMGAEVIHVEPPEGDSTRRLKGFGAGYFTFYSRNKKSLAIDLKSPQGIAIIHTLVPQVDIIVENFGPGTMDRLGLGYPTLSQLNERLIYCSLKGFLPGPYEHRHAMDEVVQMMGGLAYMTGRPGDPLRAGTSVIDITGGMFGFIGILLALHERHLTGKGKLVRSALFETTAFLMGQHMAYGAITQTPVPPMPARVSAWSIYRIFDTRDGGQVFVGIISEKHWERFCRAFGRLEWLENPDLADNNHRIAAANWFLPQVEALMRAFDKADIMQRCEEAGIPFAPIARPEDLFDDPQLNQNDSLLPVQLPDGRTCKLPNFPLDYGGARAALRSSPPTIGAHTREVLLAAGFSAEQIDAWKDEGILT